jgi:hypothetical protein
MVPGQPTGEHGGLVVEVGVEVVVAEASCWCVSRGVGEFDAAGLEEGCGVDAGDLLGQPEIRPGRCSGSPGETVENLAISFEQPLGAGREVLVGADAIDGVGE